MIYYLYRLQCLQLIPLDNVEFRRLESYKEYYEHYTNDAKSYGKALVNAPELSFLESFKIIFSGHP